MLSASGRRIATKTSDLRERLFSNVPITAIDEPFASRITEAKKDDMQVLTSTSPPRPHRLTSRPSVRTRKMNLVIRIPAQSELSVTQVGVETTEASLALWEPSASLLTCKPFYICFCHPLEPSTLFYFAIGRPPSLIICPSPTFGTCSCEQFLRKNIFVNRGQDLLSAIVGGLVQHTLPLQSSDKVHLLNFWWFRADVLLSMLSNSGVLSDSAMVAY